jgi:hypothetical protein
VKAEAELFPVGTRVCDRETGRVGILRSYMDPGDPFGNIPRNATGLRAYLLPVGGGFEFDADPSQLAPCAQD